MGIIFIIAKNNIKNYVKPRIASNKINIIFLEEFKNFEPIIKEYMPKYIILSEKINQYLKIKNYISKNIDTELIITGRKSIKINDIYINNLDEKNAILKAVRVIEDYENNIEKNNLKIVNQQVTSVFSVQGGVGKTSIALNIAHYLSKIKEIKVLLIDFNFCEGPGDLAINLKIPPVPNLGLFIENVSETPKSIWDSIINVTKNLDIIQPPLNIDQSDNFGIDMLNELIISTRKKYDYIICDVPNNYCNNTFEILNISTKTIFVIYPQLSAILRANSFLKFLPKDNKIIGLFNKSTISKEKSLRLRKKINLKIYDEIPQIADENKLYGFVNLQGQISTIENEII